MIVSYNDLVSLLSHDKWWLLQKECITFHLQVKTNPMRYIAQLQNDI